MAYILQRFKSLYLSFRVFIIYLLILLRRARLGKNCALPSVSRKVGHTQNRRNLPLLTGSLIPIDFEKNTRCQFGLTVKSLKNRRDASVSSKQVVSPLKKSFSNRLLLQVLLFHLSYIHFQGFALGEVRVFAAEFLGVCFGLSVKLEKPRALLAPDGVP